MISKAYILTILFKDLIESLKRKLKKLKKRKITLRVISYLINLLK